MTKAELETKIEKAKTNKMIPDNLRATLVAKYEKQLEGMKEKPAKEEKPAKAKKEKPAKKSKTKPKNSQETGTFKGKKLTELDEAECEELLAHIKERRESAKKSSHKSASKPVIEKIASHVAIAAKEAIENVPAADIKDDPKGEIKKMKAVAELARTFLTGLKSIMGSDYDKAAVDDEMKDLISVINKLAKKYE